MGQLSITCHVPRDLGRQVGLWVRRARGVLRHQSLDSPKQWSEAAVFSLWVGSWGVPYREEGSRCSFWGCFLRVPVRQLERAQPKADSFPVWCLTGQQGEPTKFRFSD